MSNIMFESYYQEPSQVHLEPPMVVPGGFDQPQWSQRQQLHHSQPYFIPQFDGNTPRDTNSGLNVDHTQTVSESMFILTCSPSELDPVTPFTSTPFTPFTPYTPYTPYHQDLGQMYLSVSDSSLNSILANSTESPGFCDPKALEIPSPLQSRHSSLSSSEGDQDEQLSSCQFIQPVDMHQHSNNDFEVLQSQDNGQVQDPNSYSVQATNYILFDQAQSPIKDFAQQCPRSPRSNFKKKPNNLTINICASKSSYLTEHSNNHGQLRANSTSQSIHATPSTLVPIPTTPAVSPRAPPSSAPSSSISFTLASQHDSHSSQYSLTSETPCHHYSSQQLPPSSAPPFALSFMDHSPQSESSPCPGPVYRRGRKPTIGDDALKLFVCEHCKRKFRRQEHLKRHFRSLHTHDKPYVCKDCGKSFSRSDNLSQHTRTHTRHAYDNGSTSLADHAGEIMSDGSTGNLTLSLSRPTLVQ